MKKTTEADPVDELIDAYETGKLEAELKMPYMTIKTDENGHRHTWWNRFRMAFETGQRVDLDYALRNAE